MIVTRMTGLIVAALLIGSLAGTAIAAGSDQPARVKISAPHR